jgi:hypothetical protein
MTVAEFVAKWRSNTRTERSALQEHFLDLCEVFGQRKPGEVDPAGEWFTFERGAAKQGGVTSPPASPKLTSPPSVPK